MATYVIGDVQGCFDPLCRLLDLFEFNPANDSLWFAGDLVNRGPQSLQTLRFIKNLGASATCILGNHDLHLLVVAAGFSKIKKGDTIGEILDAPDREELLEWLRQQKLFHRKNEFAMVHAGLLPQWDVSQAQALSDEVALVLQSDDYKEFLRVLYGNEPRHWDNALTGFDRLRVIVNAMTRLRLCSLNGEMEFQYKLAPHPLQMPIDFLPWFDIPHRASLSSTIIFGHWASLGFLQKDNVICLDSGCVWGRKLSALRLEDRRIFQTGCEALARH